MTRPAVGHPAPSFSLQTADGGAFTDADLRGDEATILVFYPAAFSPVCTDQLQLYEEVREEIAARGARMYGVSCDSPFAQTAFAEQLGVTIEQLSDFEPKGAASRAFGVLHDRGFSERAIVICDGEGIVRFHFVAENPGVLPGVNVLFDGLEHLGAPS